MPLHIKAIKQLGDRWISGGCGGHGSSLDQHLGTQLNIHTWCVEVDSVAASTAVNRHRHFDGIAL
jgi:hypothetical protein